jgi:UDP-arabinose 4-epimerase
MRVLVTGGAGFIGSHACKELARAGHDPVVVDNLRTGHAGSVKYGPFEYGDIRDTERLVQIMQMYKIEAVMHFAALAYVGESIEKPDIYYSNNVNGTLSLLNSMRLSGVSSIIFSSSCATYGNVNHLIRENEPQNPINPYGASKLMGERILLDYTKSFGIGSIVLRYFNAAGSDPDLDIGEIHEPETHLIPIVLQVAAGLRDEILVFGTDYDTLDGTCVRDYIHVSDLANAHTRALDIVTPGVFKAFNLGNGSGFSVLDVIKRAEVVTGRSVNWKVAPRRPGDPPSLVADASMAREHLGWAPRFHKLDDMIAHAWNFMMAREN